MKSFINKEQTLIELRKQREKDMYNSYKYQALTKAIEIVEGMPEAFVDLDKYQKEDLEGQKG